MGSDHPRPSTETSDGGPVAAVQGAASRIPRSGSADPKITVEGGAMAGEAKPGRSPEDVVRLIQRWNPRAVRDLEPMEEGQMSAAFRFHQGGEAFVIRLSFGTAGYRRDRYAYETLANATGLPIPRIQWIAEESGAAYAIAEYLPGSLLRELPGTEVQTLLPQLLPLLEGLQRGPQELHPGGFGLFSPDVSATAPDWRTALQRLFVEPSTGYYARWHDLFNDTLFPAETFWPLYERMLELAAYAPSRPFVVHGDFHTGNIMADGERITGLIDWAQALWGDWAYDVATFQLWSPQFNLGRLVMEQALRHGFDTSHFQERFWCSCYAVGLDAWRFMAKIDDRPGQEYVNRQLTSMESAEWAQVLPSSR